MKVEQPNWSVRAWALTQNVKPGCVGSAHVLAPSLKVLNLPLQRISYVPEIQDISLDVTNVAVSGDGGNFEITR
ncbi:hypothetical protein [Variovorax sp. 770b2]|uniref:hypothetical protein n=1 Tax=Variovorax sp. 770b2 TaxID=1566271 RepID=UPI0008E4121A|nr:hypothetical protein [Variovorax sp. 770b2]SFQ34001.1 hypothetical protein SAMN03159339_6839 [Variovorax sp. 770b2]